MKKYPNGVPVEGKSPFRHSYWLSFMSKRLELAKNLLKESGKIIISIDDHEVANLILLCKKIFGSKNQVAVLPTIMNLGGRSDKDHFASAHEYSIVFAKNITQCQFNELDLTHDDQIRERAKWTEDEHGWWKDGGTIAKGGGADTREERPNLFYPILIDKQTEEISVPPENEIQSIRKKVDGEWVFYDDDLNRLKKKYEKEGYAFVLPIKKTDGSYKRWRWAKEAISKHREDLLIKKNQKGEYSIHERKRLQIEDIEKFSFSKKPKTLFYKQKYSNATATTMLNRMIGKGQSKKINPKSIELIKDFIKVSTKKQSIVLDFFAGSGTTLHACIELNKKEGYEIQSIICTNNENKICQKVTYPRIQKAIEGWSYQDDKGKKCIVEGNGGLFKYYKTDFIGSNNIQNVNDEDKCQLALKVGYLLAISENTLEELNLAKSNSFQFFENKEKITAVYFKYDLSELENFKEAVTSIEKTKVIYIFSWGGVSEFENSFDHLKDVMIKPIPEEILRVYHSIYSHQESM